MSKAIVRRRRRARTNPIHHTPRKKGVPMWVWLVGGAAVVGGGGYLLYQYVSHSVSVVPGGSYTVPAGTVYINFGSSVTSALVAANASAANITQVAATPSGASVTSISFPGSSGGVYTVTWTDGTGTTQNATITCQ